MGDIIDIGNEAADRFLAGALARRKDTGPKANGRCHNCGEYLNSSLLRFCDVECRDDWENTQHRP